MTTLLPLPDDKEVTELARDALDAAARLIQDRLGVTTGDLAGMFFSGGEVEQFFEGYIRAELAAKQS